MEYPGLEKIIGEAESIVFFGGAGVSTGSGIPDFRGGDGLYGTSYEGEPPEELLSRRCLAVQPEKFFGYYRTHMIYPDAAPNGAHRALAELERRGKLTAVVTQNIDGLHQEISARVYHRKHRCAALRGVRCARASRCRALR